MAARIAVPTPSGPLESVLALPPGAGKAPAVLLIHEIWGLDAHIEAVAGRLAAQGFVVLAPHLYSTHPLGFPVEAMGRTFAVMRSLPPQEMRNAAKVQAAIDASVPAPERDDVRKAFAWVARRDLDAYVPDLQAALEWLRRHPRVDPDRVAAWGFCMGGAVVWRLAVTGAPLERSIVFYGDNPPLELVARVRGPVLGLYGETDKRITDTLPALTEAMRAAGKPFQSHVYPGVGHAFFNDTRPMHDAAAAQDSWRRVLQFLRA